MNPGDVWVASSQVFEGEEIIRIIDERTSATVADVRKPFDAIAIQQVPQLLLALIPFARLPLSKDGMCHKGLSDATECSRCGPILKARAVLDRCMPERMVWDGAAVARQA